MKYTEKYLKEKLVKYLKELDSTLELTVPVCINGRLKRTLGCVRFKKNEVGYCKTTKIDFSKSFLENAKEEDIEDVIKHELCHYYAIEKTHEDHNHSSSIFVEACERIGCISSGSTSYNYNENFKYTVKCSCCGKVIGQYHRAGNVIKYPQLCKSRCCGAELEVIQNY